jgi:predicted RNase H-like nuclease (RuvC/YqgF family)
MEHEQRADCAKQIQEALSYGKSAHHRIDDLEKDNKILHEMNKNIAVLAANYENQGKKIECIESDLKDIKNRPVPDVSGIVSDVKELKEKPAKRWDTVTTVIITAIISGTIGVIIGAVVKVLSAK